MKSSRRALELGSAVSHQRYPLPRLTAELHIPSIMAIQRSKTVALFATLIGASVCAALLVYGAPKLREFRGGPTEQKPEVAGAPQSASDGAGQQPFHARRAAVAAVKAGLRQLIRPPKA